MQSKIRPNKTLLYIFVLIITFIAGCLNDQTGALLLQPARFVPAVVEQVNWQKIEATIKVVEVEVENLLLSCDGYKLAFSYNYTFKGKEYFSDLINSRYSIDDCWPYGKNAKEHLAKQYRQGQSIHIWVNKINPRESMLERNFLVSFLVAFVPIAFFLAFCWFVTQVIIYLGQRLNIHGFAHYAPEIEPTYIPKNYTLILSSSFQPMVFVGVIVLLLVFNVIFMAPVCQILAKIIDDYILVPELYRIIFWSLICVQLIFLGVYFYSRRHSISIRLPTDIIYMGDEITIELTSEKPLAFKFMELYLTVTENATRGDGKNKLTRHKEVYSNSLLRLENKQDFTQYSLTFIVPQHLHPTLMGSSFSIQWGFLIKTRSMFWNNVPQKYEFTISPKMEISDDNKN